MSLNGVILNSFSLRFHPKLSFCYSTKPDIFDYCFWSQDSKQVVESHKSGFEPPGDVEFEDYSVSMKRAVSESSFLNARGESRRRSRSKLWPLLKRNKVRDQTVHLLMSQINKYKNKSLRCSLVVSWDAVMYAFMSEKSWINNACYLYSSSFIAIIVFALAILCN